MQLRVLLGCQQCGNKSPLERLDVQGRFFCTSCGQDRMFDEDLWKEQILPLASAVGEAYWARARVFPAFEAPFLADDSDDDDDDAEVLELVRTQVLPKVGVSKASMEANCRGMVVSGEGTKTRVMSARLTPGHPLCPTCHVGPPGEGPRPWTRRATLRAVRAGRDARRAQRSARSWSV
jgi:hypothetical protein